MTCAVIYLYTDTAIIIFIQELLVHIYIQCCNKHALSFIKSELKIKMTANSFLTESFACHWLLVTQKPKNGHPIVSHLILTNHCLTLFHCLTIFASFETQANKMSLLN